MNDIETAVAAMLSRRAERIEPVAGHRDSTLRGARRRRVAAAVGAAAVSIAVVVGGLAGVRALERPQGVRPVAPDVATESSGAYGFTSRPGEYPFAATGEFRGAKWQLRVAAVTPGQAGPTRITFQMRKRLRSSMTSQALATRVDPLFVRYEESAFVFEGEVAMVFGAVAPETETVDVWINGIDRPERTFDAHLFESYDAKNGRRADYFAAFVPSNSLGLVIAKDGDGDEVGTAIIPRR